MQSTEPDLIALLREQYILAEANYQGAKEAYRQRVMLRAYGVLHNAGIYKDTSVSILFQAGEPPKVVRYKGLTQPFGDRESFNFNYVALNKNGRFSSQSNYIELPYSDFENGAPQGITPLRSEDKTK